MFFVGKLRNYHVLLDLELATIFPFQAKSSFSFADRAGALRCVFVAPDEWGDAKTPLEKRNVRIKVHLVHHGISLLYCS